MSRRLKSFRLESIVKILNVWNDADPGIAEVEDAKKRVARLQELH
jgi:hypothetical protein